MKLSIILTVYNKEPYLDRAFRSLLNQQDVEEQDYEILAVNDGSTDNSASILEQFAQRDRRIRVITQQNQGLSMARNNGLEEALGDYVWFVDADDSIAKQSVSMLLKAMCQLPDVIPIYAITDGRKAIRNQVGPNLKTGKEVLLTSKWEHCGVFWVYKKSFLMENGLRFLPGIYHEDAEFTPRMLYLANTIKVLPEVLYTVYRGDEQSITEVPRPKRAYDMVNVVERLQRFFDNHGEHKTNIGKVMNNNNAGILNTAFYVISRNDNDEQKKFEKYLHEKRGVLHAFSKSTLLKYRFEGLLLRSFPKHSVRVFCIFRKIFG